MTPVYHVTDVLASLPLHVAVALASCTRDGVTIRRYLGSVLVETPPGELSDLERKNLAGVGFVDGAARCDGVTRETFFLPGNGEWVSRRPSWLKKKSDG